VLNCEKFVPNGFWGRSKCVNCGYVALEGVAADESVGEASLGWAVLVSDFALLGERRQAAALQNGFGLFCLAGAFDGYFVDAAEV